MIITHKLQPMDLASRGVPQRVDVMQDDKYSRNLQISLYENGSRWQIPRDVVAVIHYKKSDGTGGNYDTLPDGTLAYEISGNVLTVALAPQVCTSPGLVDFAVCLIQAESEITTFAVNIIVQPVPGADIESEEYENLTLRFFFVTQAEYDALPEEEKLAGTYFITDQDNDTDTTLTKPGQAADSFTVGERFKKVEEDMKTSGVQPDWNVNDETDPAYIKNRPFYAGDSVLTELLPEMTLQFMDIGEGIYQSEFSDVPSALIEKMSLNDQSYIVTIDGAEYACSSSPYMGILKHIGNLSLTDFDGVEDTGEPFIIGYDDDSGSALVLVTEAGTEHAISITHVDQTIHKLDEKFLPDLDLGVGKAGEGQYSEVFNYNCTAPGMICHAEGNQTCASGINSHAEGSLTKSSGEATHAEGWKTVASGDEAHAEGAETVASGFFSHAEGRSTQTYGNASHAEGMGTIASSDEQHVQGRYNVEDAAGKYAHIVGNGKSDTERSDAHTLDWDGNAWYAGYVEGKKFILPSTTAGSTKRFAIAVDDTGTLYVTEVAE